MRILFLHGFNVYDGGAATVDKVAKLLKKRNPQITIDTDEGDYGWKFLLGVHLWLLRRGAVRRVKKAVVKADAVISHSNGANFCMKALRRIEMPGLEMIHISPALNRGWKFKARHKFIGVFRTIHDKAVKWARFIPFSSWGDMGRVGASSRHAVNYNFSKTIKGHSDWFTDKNLLFVVQVIEHVLGLQNHPGILEKLK